MSESDWAHDLRLQEAAYVLEFERFKRNKKENGDDRIESEIFMEWSIRKMALLRMEIRKV